MRSYLCKVCNWTGPFPESHMVEDQKGAIKWINLCPECRNEIRMDKDIAD